MPTRPSRRDRRKGSGVISNSPASGNDAETEDGGSSAFPSLNSAMSMPTPSDCSVSVDQNSLAPEFCEAVVGPIPDGVGPGQTVFFDYLGTPYEIVVPEGCAPGGHFRVTFGSSCWEGNAGKEDLLSDAKNPGTDVSRVSCQSDESTCAGEADSSEEDVMWSTDWTVEQCLIANDNGEKSQSPTLVSSEADAEGSADGCVEESPDHIAFKDCVGPSTVECVQQQSEGVEVFELSDVSTWFTRLQQRREQALRSNKAKLVRKIDREIDLELEKLRRQGSTVAACHDELCEDPSDLDSMWIADWASLPTSSGGP